MPHWLSSSPPASCSIPPHEAIGAAVAALIAESGLTGVLLVALLRGSPELTPSFRFVWKVALATAAAAACALVPGLPSVATAALAAVAFGVVVGVTGALPPELTAAVGAAGGLRDGASPSSVAEDGGQRNQRHQRRRRRLTSATILGS